MSGYLCKIHTSATRIKEMKLKSEVSLVIKKYDNDFRYCMYFFILRAEFSVFPHRLLNLINFS